MIKIMIRSYCFYFMSAKGTYCLMFSLKEYSVALRILTPQRPGVILRTNTLLRNTRVIHPETIVRVILLILQVECVFLVRLHSFPSAGGFNLGHRR